MNTIVFPPMNPDLGRFQRPRLILDFETYFTDDYCLRRGGSKKGLGTVEYVIDPRFHVYGLAVGRPDGQTYFAMDVPAELEKLRAMYGQRLEKVVVVCHNAVFDLLILDHHYGLLPANIMDTMMLYRCALGCETSSSLADVALRLGLPSKGDTMTFMGNLDAEQMAALAEYAINDAVITAQAADLLLPMVPPLELWIMEHTIKVFLRRRFKLDMHLLAQGIAEVDVEVDKALANAGITGKEARSTNRFVAALKPVLAEVGLPLGLKRGKRDEIPALGRKDQFMRTLLAHPHPRLRALAFARLLAMSAPSLRGRLICCHRVGQLMDGKYPICLKYFGANTGRFSGKGLGMNLQNLGKAGRSSILDDALVVVPRRSLQAPDGLVFVSCDAAQIEPRALSWIAGQSDLHDDLANGVDVYCKCAASVLGREVRKPARDDPDYAKMTRFRALGKEAILGLGFGMGHARFKETLLANPDTAVLVNDGTLDDARIQGVVDWYRSTYSMISKFWKDCNAALLQALESGAASVGRITFIGDPESRSVTIRLPSGRLIAYDDVRVEHDPDETWKTEITRHNPKSKDQWWDDDDDEEDRPSGARLKLYGAKIVENIVQAVARDLLVNAVYNAERAGLPVFLTIHDDLIVAVPPEAAEATKAKLEAAWGRVPDWATGLVLMAESSDPGGSMADI